MNSQHSPHPSDNITSSFLPKHIIALDGLRGLAILSVIFFHAAVDYSPSTLAGKVISLLFNVGWGGVDLFFVLSGFLITGILLNSRGTTGYFIKFYARRTLRIFPLYYGVLFFIFVVLPYWRPFDTPALQIIARNQGWFWTYLTNFGFIAHGSVFGNADWLQLNHFWSLAVEEQFYLFWPLLIHRFSNRSLSRICLFLFVEALLLRTSLAALHQRPGTMFFPTPCRVDALALGGLIAFFVREPKITRAALTSTAWGVLAATSIALTSLFFWTSSGMKTLGLRFNERPQLTAGISLFALLSAAILLLSLDPAPSNKIRRGLEWLPLRTLGKYSYAMYIFHQLLLPVFDRYASIRQFYNLVHSEALSQIVHAIVMIVGSLALAFLSWHLYEKHFLRLKTYFAYRQDEIGKRQNVFDAALSSSRS